MTDFLPTGKLPNKLLSNFLEKYSHCDDRVIVGPKVGEDAAVIDFGRKYLIAKTDPITFVVDDIGFYAININANDIATMGGIPKWFLATILLPEGKTTVKRVEGLFSQLSSACRDLGISLCGGHTEITHGIARPLVVGQMLGEVVKDGLVTTSGARVGDDIILTKGIAIEATSIIAREKSRELLEKHPSGFVEKCYNFVHDPGISVLNEAAIATQTGKVNSMHDPTEGGLATGLHEIAGAADVGIEVYKDKISVIKESQVLCAEYDIDPLGAIASGALLITATPRNSRRIINKLKAAGINADVIGKIVRKDEGVKMIDGNIARDLPVFDRDEITKIF